MVEEALVSMSEEPRWPNAYEDATEFLEQVVREIMDKGYCVIDMPPLQKHEKRDLDQSVNDLKFWSLPKKEWEEAYLGRDNCTKYCTLADDLPETDVDDTLAKCDRHLTELTMLLAPVTQPVFGFNTWGRISGMVRAPLQHDDHNDQVIRPQPLQPPDYEDGRVYGHLNFLERRKLIFLYLLQSSGGEVVLHNFNGEPDISIPIADDKLLVWRHDLRAFTYKPELGDSLALQTWILSEPWEPDAEDGPLADLPEHMEQENRVSVMAAHMHTAGSMNSMENYWSGMMGSVDGQVHVPIMRWDHDTYYSQDQSGTANCKHGGFVDEDRLVCFDASFFCISEAEMPDISPAQRMVLDTGYETMNLAGYNKDTLRGLGIANFVGDSQSDWINLANLKTITPTSYTGLNNAITAMRLSYCFGIRGPCQHIDTACSSSLVALNRAHVAIKKVSKNQFTPNIGNNNCDRALVTGLSLCLDPHLYIGYSGAGMLSKSGRCFTFDYSANGFARGEGCGATFLQSSKPEQGHPDMMAALVGSFTNQDGRSATMTAPNGPSQTSATGESLMESGFFSEDVSACECHGTGTPLGDPIEFRALQVAFTKGQNHHPTPLPHSSAKTNIGHGEANAGMAGFLKCVMMVIGCTNPGNNHLHSLNPNMDLAGYPAWIGDIGFDFGPNVNTGLMGVSSFGSGGTNARADIWGRSQRGAFKTVALADYSDLMRKKELYFERVDLHGKPGPNVDDTLSIIGTWDAWSAEVPMDRIGDGEYMATITLGDTQCEQFHIVVNSDRAASIHPRVPMAVMDEKIDGPDAEGKGLNWKINGRAEEAPPGTRYTVVFRWAFDWERGESKIVSWERSDEALEDDQTALAYLHEYYVVSSWTGWKFYKLTPSTEEAGLYSLSARIGSTGQEEFQIVRDRDWSQVIYPATNNPIKTHVPIKGPDEHGSGKNWLVRGPPGFKMDVELRMHTGNVQLSLNIEKKGKKTWKSTNADNWHEYYVSGSWNSWGLSLMSCDVPGRSVFRLRDVIIGKDGFEDFKIVVDKDLDKVLYPVHGTAHGPDAEGDGHHWRIEEAEGEEFEIELDYSSGFPSVSFCRV